MLHRNCSLSLVMPVRLSRPLIPLVAFWLADKTAPAFIRAGALLVLGPLPLLLLVSDKPLVGQILIISFVLLTLLTALSRGTLRLAPHYLATIVSS